MKQIIINKAQLSDLPALQQISRKTFYETFAAQNTEENMTRFLDEFYATEKLTQELTDPNTDFFFAWLDNKMIGYLKINRGIAQTELKNENGLEIERIYVLKEYQGNNLGRMLFDKALEIAREMNADYLWLGVWEENKKAIRFYEKNGLVAFDKHQFTLGDDIQTDIMMKLSLK